MQGRLRKSIDNPRMLLCVTLFDHAHCAACMQLAVQLHLLVPASAYGQVCICGCTIWLCVCLCARACVCLCLCLDRCVRLVQAYLDKHKQRHSRLFAPNELRELAPTERTGSDSVSYVKLEGLGKIPFSNIRRPKPLMDVEPAPAPTKPEQGTPLLHIVAFYMLSAWLRPFLDVLLHVGLCFGSEQSCKVCIAHGFVTG